MEIITMKQTKREYSQFLIIDDDPGIAKFMVTYLRQRGHTCQALTDGFQTASWLSENDCEVAIVDLKMPKVDGISLISFMRELNPTLPIVVFTAEGRPLSAPASRRDGALDADARGSIELRAEAAQCGILRTARHAGRLADRGSLAGHGDGTRQSRHARNLFG